MSTFKIKSSREVILINKNRMENEPIKAPITIFFIVTILLRSTATLISKIKLKEKLISKTKSKYTFMASPNKV